MTETQAWALLALGAASAAIALLSVMTGRWLTARRATLDFLRDYYTSPEVGRAFKILRASPHDNIPLENQNREDFLFLMNMFEVLAIGLERGIYDKRMTVQFFGRDLKIIWEKALPFVMHLRTQEKDPDAFREFEKLTDRTRSETKTRIR